MIRATILAGVLMIAAFVNFAPVRANMAPPMDEFTLGLTLERTDDGVVVASVEKVGAAARAGVEPGDMILAIDRQYIGAFSDEDIEALATQSYVWPIELIVVRGGTDVHTFTLASES